MTSSIENSPDRRKFALLIGNDNYSREENKLSSSSENVKQLSNILETINFTVTTETNIADKIKIMETVKSFTKIINDGDLVLFYFAGHAYHFNKKNYLIPTEDTKMDTDADVETLGADVQRILDRLTEEKSSSVTIFVLDCCRSYLLSGRSTKTSTTQSHGLHKIEAPPRTFIQFACAHNETTTDDLFSKHLLKNIAEKNIEIRDVFKHVVENVYQESNQKQQPLSVDGIPPDEHIYSNQVKSLLPNIAHDAKWKLYGQTIAGGHGPGSTSDRLHRPESVRLNKKQTMLITDISKQRTMKLNQDSNEGQKVVGKISKGSRSHLLVGPSNVVSGTKSDNFIICDYPNRRVLRWLRGKDVRTEAIIGNSEYYGVAVDRNTLYVSDTERHEVKRYELGDMNGTVVAGGNGQGRRFNQLNHPTYICIGDDESLYVSDSWNDRVVRWDKGAKTGVIVAGGKRKGKDRRELDNPAGVAVDQLGTVYVADSWNHRVMRWRMDEVPDMIAGDRFLPGNDGNQLNCPEGLAFDESGNLYVADSDNHRIQKFEIQTN